PAPDFGLLERRATRRGRRRVAVVAAATAAVLAGSALVLTRAGVDRRTAPAERPEPTPKAATAPNGWVAVDAYQGDGEVYLGRLGADAHRLELAGSDAGSV